MFISITILDQCDLSCKRSKVFSRNNSEFHVQFYIKIPINRQYKVDTPCMDYSSIELNFMLHTCISVKN